MKRLISTILTIAGAALPVMAQTPSGGGTATGSAQSSTSVRTVNSATPATPAGNAAVVQQNGARVINPVNPNPGLVPGANVNNNAAQFATGGASNSFTAAAGATNNNIANTNFFPIGTNFAGLNGTNGEFTASNQFSAVSNFLSTNAFFGTNFSGQDRGFTVFDTKLIFNIRRVVFDANPQLTALNQLINFMSQGGNVTVSGVVPTAEIQQTVVSNVTAVPGVVAVNSRLVVDPRAAGVFARANQPQASTNLAPTSDPALGDSRLYQSSSNRFNVRQNVPSTALPSAATNQVSPVISTP